MSLIAPGLLLLGAKGTVEQKLTETFEAPAQHSSSPTMLAQVLRKKPETATADAATTTRRSRRMSGPDAVSTSSRANLGIKSAAGSHANSTSMSLPSLLETPAPAAASAVTRKETSNSPLFSGVSTSTEELQRLILSSPPIGYESATTIPIVTAPVDVYTSDIVDLDLNTTQDLQRAEFSLPETPLPKDELDRLTSSSKGAKRITLMAAICQSLQANQNLRVEKLRPEITNYNIMAAESEFDTNLDAGVFYSVAKRSTLGPTPKDGGSTFSQQGEDTAVSRNLTANIGVSGRLPTGTNYSLGFTTTRNSTNSTNPFYSSVLNANITQNLLRGAGCDVNLVRVWTAKNNFVSSLYSLQQTLINLVDDVQNAYWDVYLASKTLEIQITAYEVARELRLRAEEFVRVGRAAPLEAYSAQAEESSRISAVIQAASDLKRRQLDLLRLINPECMATGWRTLIWPAEPPILPTERLVPEEHVRLARFYRPDLRQAQIDLANGELEVVRTENGLLPQLDFVTDLSLAGSGNSFGTGVDKIGSLDFPTYRTGFQFSYPLQNRAATAAYRRAQFTRQLAEESIANFCQIIDFDIRAALIEIDRTGRLIDSTRVTEALRQRELEAESEKFRVGRSTQINVNQAQRDLVQAQLDTVRAVIANMKSYLALYRAEGTSLLRRGIEPIKITPESGVP